MSERFAKYEADAQAKLDANQEAAGAAADSGRRNEAFLARAEKANDTAQLELYGSQGRTFTEPGTGSVIADKDNPITGKLDSIRSNRRFGTTEDERNGAADMYEIAILRDVEEDGLPLAQAKLIADLEFADIEKRGKLIGKQVSEGKSVAEAQDSVDILMTRLADRRRAMILEGGALTMADYDALREGKDLYPAPESSDDETREGEEAADDAASQSGGAKSQSEQEKAAEQPEDALAKLSKEELGKKRALMVKNGIKALDVGNMSDDEIDRYNLVEKDLGDSSAEKPEAGSSADEALRRIANGEPMLDVTKDLAPKVDLGEDLEDIEVDDDEEEDAEDDATPVDNRNRRQRAAGELRELWDNRRSPYSYLHSRMTNALAARVSARAEARASGVEQKDRLRGVVAGVVGAIALTGVAIYAYKHQVEVPIPGGSGGGNQPPQAPMGERFPTDLLPGNGSVPKSGGGIVETLSKEFKVEHGNGYIAEIKQAAEAAGQDISLEKAEQIHKAMVGEFGNDYIDINGLGADTYMAGSDVRLREPGKAKWVPEAVERLSELIKK